MPWSKSGTVSVVQNSNAVIGDGTSFIANGRVGDGFRGPDGGWYEVTNIASDTALSIDPPYQGATLAAAVYALAPLQGYVKDTADALREASRQAAVALDGLEEAVEDATASAAAALASENAAALSQSSASSSAADALVSKDAAASSEAAAESAASAALSSKNAAAISETNAGDSAASALASKNAAAQSAAEAASSVGDKPSVTIPSASTVNIGGAESNVVIVTGTTAITFFGTAPDGIQRVLIFAGSLVLTHNASSLILPGNANVTTVAGDSARFVSRGGGNWKCLSYTRADGKALVSPAPVAPAWGGIGGTLSAQTDLQAALDGKLGNNILSFTARVFGRISGTGTITALDGSGITGVVRNSTGNYTISTTGSWPNATMIPGMNQSANVNQNIVMSQVNNNTFTVLTYANNSSFDLAYFSFEIMHS